MYRIAYTVAAAIVASGALVYFSPAARIYRAANASGLVTISDVWVIPDACRDMPEDDGVLCALLATVGSQRRDITTLERDKGELREELDVRRQAYTVSVAAVEFEDGSLTDIGINAAIGACEVVLPPGETTLRKPIHLTGAGMVSSLVMRSESPVQAMVHVHGDSSVAVGDVRMEQP
jgi:hypothetical protein